MKKTLRLLRLFNLGVFPLTLCCSQDTNEELFDKYEKFRVAIDFLAELNPQVKKNKPLQKITIDKIEETNKIYYFELELINIPKLSWGKSLFKLTWITGMVIENCDLSFLPLPFKKFTFLAELSLNKNKFEYIPDVLGRLPNLKMLFMDNNKIKNIPDFIFKSKIDTLWLNNNYLTLFPVPIEENNTLTSLSINNNPLEKKILLLYNLNRLTHFSATHCGFVDILNLFPSQIEKIILSYNEIKIIPNNLNFLQSLKIIDLSYNNISKLPTSIFLEIPHNKINLTGNPLDESRYTFRKYKYTS